MAEKTDYEISIDNWKKEQENLIDLLQNNIDYLEKEIELKTRALQINKDSLIHEKQALENYFNKEK